MIDIKTEKVTLNNKNNIDIFFLDAKKEMGLEDVAKFGDYYFRNDTSRAERNGIDTIRFNEKFLSIPDDEKQRVAYHELQHVQNIVEIDNSDDSAPQIWVFTFTELFSDIHNRMLKFYTKNKNENYQFGKKMYELPPINYQELSDRSDSYDHYDELLSLLRGYQTYLRQKEAGIETHTQPYEFIDAFIPDDLKLLDRNYREKILNDIGKENISKLLS